MKNTAFRSGLSLLLALLLALSLAACGKKPESQSESESEISSSESAGFFNPLKLPDGFKGVVALQDYTKNIEEAVKKNDDTVGWLHIPGTKIDEAIVCKSDPQDYNQYYYRRNFDKVAYANNDWQSGPTVLWADCRITFDGTTAGLPTNTTIYGHNVNVNDDPNDSYVMFAPLINFKTEEFAKKTPYIYFSTPEENLVWEVFAASYLSEKLAYNTPDMAAADWMTTVEEVRKHSLYNYDVEVTEKDKVLTLSTCTYHLQDGTNIGYPTNIRFVVVAKLIETPTTLKTEASMTPNASAKVPTVIK